MKSNMLLIDFFRFKKGAILPIGSNDKRKLNEKLD
jgi:hypothetical protein